MDELISAEPTQSASNLVSDHAAGKRAKEITSRRSPAYSGPLSSEMWQRAQKIDSSYPDRFDYRVYDDLYNKFGEEQPRGGVIFGTPIRLIEAEDCKHCFYRFELDTYGRGCIFNCAYCYAKSYLSIRKWWNEPQPFPLDIANLRKIFATIFESDRSHKYRAVMEKRIPLRIGSMSDSFMRLDVKYKVTQEVLRLLNFYRYPHIIFTRSDLVGEEPYLSLLDSKLASVQMSISSLNTELTKKIEPGAPAPLKRLKALQKVSEKGIWTTVRINPLFPIYPDGYFTDPTFDRKKDIKPFNYFSWEMIEVIAAHKIPSLLTGVVRLYQPNLRFMKKALGYDIREHFGSEKSLERASLHFSPSETGYYYEQIKKLCDQHSVRFSTCYIGNDPSGSSFFKYQPLWTNKKDCCDAVGNVTGFKKTCADIPHPSAKKDSPIIWN